MLRKVLITTTIVASLAGLSACVPSEPVKPIPLSEQPLDISSSITDSHQFDLTPFPRTKILRYEMTQVNNPGDNSVMEINLIRTKNHITEYETTQNINQLSIKGKNIAFGGIAPFKIEKQRWLQDKLVSASGYRIASINNVAGRLFPLKVGNQMSYGFTANYSRNGQVTLTKQSTAMFEVVGHMNNFTNGSITVPGDVYVIRYSEADSNGVLQQKAEYEFSTGLGWVVQMTEYQNNQPSRVYNLIDSQNSLAFMKPGQH